ncbi:LuxR C-terminal-related transcriptional regulator [Streptomyces erythrochromogenes]|uniref:helix-turn-helix transcriptional regulator n=1 Tax=Streptomyces erythrochromogenes TaxID=285574 RepID=UPI0038265836
MAAEIDSQEALLQILFRTARGRTSWDSTAIADEVGCGVLEAEDSVDRLKSLGILTPAPGTENGYTTVEPATALTRLLALENELTEEWYRGRRKRQTAIEELMKRFPLHTESATSAQIEILMSPSDVNDFLEESAADARTLEQAMHPGGVPPIELIDDMLLRDAEVLDRGVRLQGIYARHLATIPYLRNYLTDVSREGADVRLADTLPLRMILIDGATAFLPLDPQDSSAGAFALRSPEVVRSLSAVFAFHWSVAVPLGATRGGGATDLELTPEEQVAVRMMAMGAKDEAIARHLGFSTRTLSRMISRMLERLGVETRFQAAAKLTHAGVLDSSSTPAA